MFSQQPANKYKNSRNTHFPSKICDTPITQLPESIIKKPGQVNLPNTHAKCKHQLPPLSHTSLLFYYFPYPGNTSLDKDLSPLQHQAIKPLLTYIQLRPMEKHWIELRSSSLKSITENVLCNPLFSKIDIPCFYFIFYIFYFFLMFMSS